MLILAFIFSLFYILDFVSTCNFPKATKNITVTKNTVYVVQAGQTMDFKNARLIGSGLGACDRKMNNKYHIIRVNNGGTVKNVILGPNNGAGIACAGSCTLQNVFWENVCFHAAGLACETNPCTSAKSYTYKIIGGAGRPSQDKYFTQSGQGTTLIDGFCGEGLGTAPGGSGGNGKVWCSCGMCNPFLKRSAIIQNSQFSGKGLALASINTFMGDTVTFKNVVVNQSGSNKIKHAVEEYDSESNARAAIPKLRRPLNQVSNIVIKITK